MDSKKELASYKGLFKAHTSKDKEKSDKEKKVVETPTPPAQPATQPNPKLTATVPKEYKPNLQADLGQTYTATISSPNM